MITIMIVIIIIITIIAIFLAAENGTTGLLTRFYPFPLPTRRFETTVCHNRAVYIITLLK